jgi:hypothetical protein
MGYNLRQDARNAEFSIYEDRLQRDVFKLDSSGNFIDSGVPSGPRFFDDFLGDVIDARWAVAKGSDAQCVDFAHLTGVNGMIRATMGDDAAADMATNGVQLHQALQWFANSGGLVMECRIKLAAITTSALFVGLTDQIASLEMPFTLGGSDALTSNATDAVGFLFDTAADTDQIFAVGVKADTDASHATTGIVPVADTYNVLRVEVDSSGHAKFFVDGVLKNTIANCVTASVALTPCVAGFRRAATANNFITVDYILVQSSRA